MEAVPVVLVSPLYESLVSARPDIVSVITNRLLCDLPCTNQIANWEYSQTEAADGLTSLYGNEMVALSGEWRNYSKLAA